MTDEEIIPLIEMCSYMFGVHRIADGAVTAFAYMLKSKFPAIKGEKIIQLCTETAATQRDKEIKFTPAVLASILQSNQQEYRPMNYAEREMSTAEKIKYRQQFLKDLYADFDLHKAGKKTVNIIVWDYVARQLVSAGYAERLPEIKHEQTKGEKGNVIRNTYASLEGFVKDCFNQMIKNNKHISEIIHGIN